MNYLLSGISYCGVTFEVILSPTSVDAHLTFKDGVVYCNNRPCFRVQKGTQNPFPMLILIPCGGDPNIFVNQNDLSGILREVNSPEDVAAFFSGSKIELTVYHDRGRKKRLEVHRPFRR